MISDLASSEVNSSLNIVFMGTPDFSIKPLEALVNSDHHIVAIFSQPTWGVDIGAATAIRQKLLDLSQNGKAVILISQDLEEIFELSDKICVINEGILSKREVELLRYEKEKALISDGFEKGDKILLTRLDVLIEGMKLEKKDQ